MLASDSRGYTAVFTDHGGAYGFDSEYDGLEPLFHNLENGDQIDNCPRHWTALNPYLESTPMADVFEFSGQDVKQREKGLNHSIGEQVYKVLTDHQDGLYPRVAVSMQMSNCFDQKSKWRTSERTSEHTSSKGNRRHVLFLHD